MRSQIISIIIIVIVSLIIDNFIESLSVSKILGSNKKYHLKKKKLYSVV